MPYKVEITSCSHDPSKTIGYAEGKIDRREFVASWASFQPLGGLFYDTWLDTTLTQDRAIAKALNNMNAVPKVRVYSPRTGKHKSSNKFSSTPY